MDSEDVVIRPIRRKDEKQILEVFTSSMYDIKDSIFKTLIYRKITPLIFFGQMTCLYYVGILSGISLFSNLISCVIWGLSGTLGLYYYEAQTPVDKFRKKQAFEMDLGCFKYYNQRRRACFVAVAKDKIVGLVAMDTTSYSGVCRFQRLSVLSGYKRQGIAKRLVLRLERAANQVGYRKITLKTTVFQQPAIQLFQKLGYTKLPATFGPPLLTEEFKLVTFEKVLE